MRFLARFCLVGVVAVSLVGCDSGSGVTEGVPKNVDMKKDYSPNIDMPGASVKDMQKAKAKPKTVGEPSAPAETK